MPTYVKKGNKIFPSMYESNESKAFKKHFQNYLKQLIANSDWDIEQTREGHWYLDCVFVQSRTNQDSNNFFKILLDSMTGVLFIDDSNILVRVQKVLYNPKNPRFVATLKPVEYVGLFKNKEQLNEFEDKCSTCSRYRNGSCSILKSLKGNREVAELKLEDSKLVCEEYKQKK